MRIEVGAGIVLAVAALAWGAFNRSSGASDGEPAPQNATHAAPASATSPMDEGVSPTREADIPPSNAVPIDRAAAPGSAAGHEIPAAWSLADSRVTGDDRAPPIQRADEGAATPAWQLDNHQAYARREQDRHQAVQRAFVDAADRELPLLERQIEQGRAMGLPPEQLAKGEEKRRRIAEMRERMQANLAASAAAP